MPTRHKKPYAPLSQERFASSRSGEVMLGNLVAKKCEIVKSARHRRIILFLQDVSLRVGCRTHPTANLFPAWPFGLSSVEHESPFERIAREMVQMFPAAISPSVVCKIPAFLIALCLVPSCDPATAELPGCLGFLDMLERYRERFCAASLDRVADTSVTSTVHETLDYALSQGGMVLIESHWRSGKSFSAQSFALSHVGECRYVQLSSSRDTVSFYRDVARCLGTACSTQRKASEIRMRIEAMLRTQSLLLILDEAQYIWPKSLRPQTPPEIVFWIISALLNSGVTVALVASYDFTRLLRNVELKCPVFGSEQWHGRMRRHVQLKDMLNKPDLFKIAYAIMPEATEAMAMLLVGHALKSKSRIAAVEIAASRARFFAEKQAREVVFEDIEAALVEAGSAAPRIISDAAADPSRNVRGTACSNARSIGGNRRRVKPLLALHDHAPLTGNSDPDQALSFVRHRSIQPMAI